MVGRATIRYPDLACRQQIQECNELWASTLGQQEVSESQAETATSDADSPALPDDVQCWLQLMRCSVAVSHGHISVSVPLFLRAARQAAAALDDTHLYRIAVEMLQGLVYHLQGSYSAALEAFRQGTSCLPWCVHC